ncbi:MAG: hypothetical protein M0P77_08115 [Firmicutes bacterium]|nr:hypothetical protein [Bacillota bacterium]
MSKKRKRASSLFILPIILIVIVCSYIIRYIYFSIDTEIIKYGAMESSFDTKGLIIRNEWVYNYNTDLQLKNKIPEGQRIPYGKKIVEIVKGEENIQDDLLTRVSKLEERIEEIEKSEANNPIFEKDIEKLNKNINNKIELIKNYSMEGDVHGLENLKSELSKDLYKKSLIVGNNSFAGKNLEQLKSEKTQLEELYSNNLDAVYAKTSGIVSYNLDGLEQSLNPINLNKISIEDVKRMIFPDEVGNKIEYQKGVKIVEDYTWYICCIFDEGQVKDLKEGSRISLLFKDRESQPINAKIKSISDPVNKEYLIIFEINEFVEDYYNVRLADVTVITCRHEGFMVSRSSIVDNDKQKGVFIIKKGIIKFVPAEIIATEDNKALIKNVESSDEDSDTVRYIIKVYDEVVKNTKKVKDNQRIM